MSSSLSPDLNQPALSLEGHEPYLGIQAVGCMAECRITAGDTLVLYTDGITESFNGVGEEFGEERLINALRQPHELPPQALLDSVVQEVRRFSPHEQHDDITLIVARAV